MLRRATGFFQGTRTRGCNVLPISARLMTAPRSPIPIYYSNVNVDEDEYLKKTGGGKKAGIIQTFEDRYMFPCVLRNYGRSSSSNDGKRRREGVLHVNDDLGDDLYLHADDNGDNGDPASSLHARRRGGDIELRSSSSGNEFRGRRKKTALMDADDDEGSVCLADDDGNTIEYIRQSSGGLSAVC